jgi:uncharacterized protein DUF6786
MKFREVCDLLRDTANEPVILQGRQPGRQVLCAPTLVGRVMTTTYDADHGDALGWIGAEVIRHGYVDPVFTNYGGEERLWFGPEGSQFGLHFTSKDQSLSHYKVQAGMNSQRYAVARIAPEHDCVVMAARIELQNLAGTKFDLGVERTVRVADYCPYTVGFDDHLEFVGFESKSLVTNLGREPIRSETGLLSCWTPGQHPSGARTVAVIPFQPGSNEALGEPIRSDYLKQMCVGGTIPAGRLWIGADHALMRADNRYRLKIGLSARRATNRLGTIDLDSAELVINDFDLYPEMPYVAPYWRELTAAELANGEAVSVYVDGPDEKGVRGGNFHELESLSPAMPLKPGESFAHRNRVFHVRGSRTVLDSIARSFLHTDTAEVTRVFPELR